jgi:hypothetical protein
MRHALEPSYAGIDVAVAKNKRLPISVSVRRDGRLEPLLLRSSDAPLAPEPAGKPGMSPRGQNWSGGTIRTADHLLEPSAEGNPRDESGGPGYSNEGAASVKRRRRVQSPTGPTVRQTSTAVSSTEIGSSAASEEAIRSFSAPPRRP